MHDGGCTKSDERNMTDDAPGVAAAALLLTVKADDGETELQWAEGEKRARATGVMRADKAPPHA